MSFQSISRVTLVCCAVTSSGPNAEYIDIAQNVQDYIGCDELQESCLCLMSDADESGVRVLALVHTDRDVWEAGRFSTAAATIGNVCTVKLINLNAVNTYIDFVYRTAGSHCTLKAWALGFHSMQAQPKPD